MNESKLDAASAMIWQVGVGIHTTSGLVDHAIPSFPVNEIQKRVPCYGCPRKTCLQAYQDEGCPDQQGCEKPGDLVLVKDGLP